MHHIKSILYCVINNIPSEVYNRPDNLIVLSEEEHTTKLHPDAREIDGLKVTAPEEFRRRIHEIDELVLSGGKNWDPTWDDLLSSTAIRHSKCLLLDEPWPQPDQESLTAFEFDFLMRSTPHLPILHVT